MHYFSILISVICLLFLNSCTGDYQVIHAFDNNKDESSQEHNITNDFIVVDIKGEVMYPGVYKIREGSLLIELIDLAGGYTKHADIDKINQASIIYANQMIQIPKLVELTYENSTNGTSNSLININQASSTELSKLPGIGTAKAEAIVAYREGIGYYSSIEDLKKVKGIGNDLYEKVKDYVCI